MAETANIIPEKGLGKLRLEDLWKGFIKSCGGLLIGLIIKLIQDKFKLPAYSEIEPLLEATAYFFLGYIGLNTATNNVGQLFTKDKAVTSISKTDLDDLKAKAATAP
jgi:uncharacterized protein YacL